MSWVKVGQDIDGEGPGGDYSGYSVSLSANGTRVAIGAPYNDGSSILTGHVRIYDLSGTTWVQVGQDIDGEAAGDYSGYSVSLSANGSRVAIGARLNADNGYDSGHVRIYDLSGTTWVQVGQDIDGEVPGDWSGYSVSLSSDGTRVAIGARLNAGNGSYSGHVRIYDLSGTTWVQVGQDINGEAANDQSGHSVSLSANGSRVAIGAIFNDGNGSNAGHVRIYDLSGTTWVQVGQDIDGEAAGDWSGYSVSLSSDGSRVAIGAINNDGNGSNAGHVRIYDLSGTTWVQVGQDIDGEAAGDQSGYSVSLSSTGTRVAIGAIFNDGSGNDSGHVRIYDLSGTTWVQLGQDINGEAAGDYSGYSVSLSSDGSRVAIGAPRNGDNGSYSGHVRVFDLIVTPPAPVPCLPAGTRVLTAAGYKAVEQLAQDDLIITSNGHAVSFKLYSTDVDKAAEVNAPYLIPANTFGKFPVKDLTLSPNHAFQSRPGVWQIPKYAAMMYPSAIRQVSIGKPVTYYHIETPDYFKDNLMVEGTPVESFAHKQLRKGEIVYSYSVRYNGFIRSQAARQSQVQAHLTK